LEKNKLIVSYDKEADVFYLSFGEPKQSVTEELDDHVLVRRDPKTGDLTAITITNLNEYFETKRERKLEIPASSA
jgi:uncharacterized protein YuzE